MNSTAIDAILSRSAVTRPYYRGCVLSDHLGTAIHLKPHELNLIVVNTLTSSQPESDVGHFIPIIVFPQRQIFYLDSLGESVSQLHNLYISRFILSIANQGGASSLHQNVSQYQSESSCMCGVYCIYVCLYAASRQTLAHVFDRFSPTRFAQNDQQLFAWFASQFPQYLGTAARRRLMRCIFS